MECHFYRRTWRGAFREAWVMFWTPLWRTVGFLAAALSAFVALSRRSDTAVLVSVSSIAGFALTYLVLAVGNRWWPMRKHWKQMTDNLESSVIFDLASLHNHERQLHSVRLVLRLPSGEDLSHETRALNVRPGDVPIYVQYPHKFEGHAAVQSGTYRFTWYVNTEAGGRWMRAAHGSHDGPPDPSP